MSARGGKDMNGPAVAIALSVCVCTFASDLPAVLGAAAARCPFSFVAKGALPGAAIAERHGGVQ